MVDTGDDGAGGAPGQRDIAAQPVIDAFGGIRPMAAKLGVPVSTVQGWKQRDTIPASRVPSIAAAARAHGVSMPTDLQAAPVQPAYGISEESPPASEPVVREGPRPRPGIRFSRPEDWEAQPQPAGAPPSRPAPEEAARASDAAPHRPASPAQTGPTSPPPPAAGDGAAARRATGAIALAAVALAAAVLWPIAFSAWFGADAQEGSGGADAAALAERVTALEQAASGPDEGLQQAVSALQADVEALRDAGGGWPEALDAIATRLEALEQASAAPDGAGAAVSETLDSLERLVRSLDSAVSGLEQRLAAVETEVGRLEGGGDAAALEQLRQAVDTLQATLGAVQSDLRQVSDLAGAAREDAVGEASALVESEIARLDGRIAALAGVDDAAAAHQSFLIALGQLEAQLQAGRPFDDQLAALQQVTKGSDTLTPLTPTLDDAFGPLVAAADGGVPTLVDLRARFEEARRAVLAATDAPPEDMLDEIWGEVRGLVTVSRVDGAGTGTVDGLLATAEAHLAAGNVAGAADAMEGLSALGEGFATAAADWIAAARLRVAADAAVESVRQAALTVFRPPSPAAAPAETGPPGPGHTAPQEGPDTPEDGADAAR